MLCVACNELEAYPGNEGYCSGCQKPALSIKPAILAEVKYRLQKYEGTLQGLMQKLPLEGDEVSILQAARYEVSRILDLLTQLEEET